MFMPVVTGKMSMMMRGSIGKEGGQARNVATAPCLFVCAKLRAQLLAVRLVSQCFRQPDVGLGSSESVVFLTGWLVLITCDFECLPLFHVMQHCSC
jgi:hypothetical protein